MLQQAKKGENSAMNNVCISISGCTIIKMAEIFVFKKKH